MKWRYALLLVPVALMWLPGTSTAHPIAPPGPQLPQVAQPPATPTGSFQVTLTRPG